MVFLIDFENVHHVGLEGFEYLDRDDTIVMFYSKTCEKIKRYRLNQIMNAGCKWEICELVRIGKNALDFYIASKVGEIFSVNPGASIGIVSKDKGFRAVKDYWKVRLVAQNRLVQGDTVAECMRKGFDDTGRDQRVRTEIEQVSLIEEYKGYLENRRIKVALKERFGNDISQLSIPRIVSIVKNETTPKAKYLATLRTFGIKEGPDVYRIIRNLNTVNDQNKEERVLL